MSFTNLYLIGGGAGSSDINAGSSIGASQAAPTTSGSWVNATNTFVATGGTPFGATVIGDYVSIYADGATVTTYSAQVTSVVSNVSVILSGTIKYGTAPTDGPANRSAVAGGSWNSEIVLAATGLGTFTVPQPTKINIKQATYTVAASRTISIAGATTTPIWFSGYNTTPGDLDADTTNSLAKPILALSATFIFTLSGAYQIWSGVSVTGNRSGTIWSMSGSNCLAVRCRFENTSTNAAAIAFTFGATGGRLAYSWCKCPATATTTGVVQIGGASATCVGVVADTGGIAGFNAAGNTSALVRCIGLNNTGAGILATTAGLVVVDCTIYNATVDGLKWSSTPVTNGGHVVVGTLFVSGSNTMTNGINNASGTNTSNVFRSNNDYFNVTNPEVGFGDSPAWFGQAESLSPVISATNMTPIAGSNARANGFPGIYETETFSSYQNIGAVQQLAGGGFAGGVFGG